MAPDFSVSSIPFPQNEAEWSLAEIAREAPLVFSGIIEITHGINEGIKSSQFDSSTAIVYGQSRMEIYPLLQLTPHDDVMRPYYFEAQRSHRDPTLMLAQIMAVQNGKRYVQWATNDKAYALSHPNVFDPDIVKIDACIFQLRYFTRDGAVFSDQGLHTRIL